METGQPVVSVSVIAKVLKSDNPKIKEGAIVLLTGSGTEEYSSVPESAVGRAQIIEPQDGVPLTAYLGVLGMTGDLPPLRRLCPDILLIPVED